MKVDILAIGVHPDDIELCASGTILKHINLGHKVGLCDLTQGELGTRGSAELRLQEAEDSRKIMGAAFRENLAMADGFFLHDKEHLISIARVIRKYQPDIILANAIRDRHPDHGRASKLISDACFFSGLVKIDIDGLEPWRPRAVYHYVQDREIHPDFVVDITPYMDKKFECIMAFSSQFYNPDSEDRDTPISGKGFMEYIKAKNRIAGRHIGVDFAEAFTVERPIGIDDMLKLR